MKAHVHHWLLEGAEQASREGREAVHHVTGRCACGAAKRFRAFVDAVTLGDSIIGTHRRRQARDEGAA